MDYQHEKLREFFEKVKTINFWQRLFGWGHFKALSYDAYSEYSQIISKLDAVNKELDNKNNATLLLQKEKEHLLTNNSQLSSEANAAKQKLEELNSAVVTYKEENAGYKKVEDDRRVKYEEKVATLNATIERIQKERDEEIKQAQKTAMEELEGKKKTWSKHQDDVRNKIKIICQKLTIEYVEKAPFKGSPDNTIKICDEHVVFDAKSPAADDLSNFPIYIKVQAESAKKYANQDSVRKDIFLVVPFNTIEVLGQFVYNMADYNVYVVSLDVLEPLILSLKKIEEYEFIEQLSPEERENICRIIGKFAHMTKRRIQIDEFFMRQFIEILTKCESDLPKDIMDKIIEFEKQDKLNPPQEKRAKQISSKELIDDGQKIKKEAEAKSIAFPESIDETIKSVPLYSNDEDKT